MNRDPILTSEEREKLAQSIRRYRAGRRRLLMQLAKVGLREQEEVKVPGVDQRAGIPELFPEIAAILKERGRYR